MTTLNDSHHFFDFGKDAFGTLMLMLKSPPRDSLVIHIGEKLEGTHQIDRKPGGTIRYQRIVLRNPPLNKVFTVPFHKDGRNDQGAAVILPDSLGVIVPFRYVEIEGLKGSPEGIRLTQNVLHYRFNDTASAFSSSDTVLNRVWELCKYTIKATTFAGLYVDGDRERIPYEADAYINQLGHYAVDSEYDLARRTNEYFMQHPTWPTEWLLHTVPLFYNDYLYTGNTEALARHYEALKRKTLAALAREDGLLDTDSSRITPALMRSLGFSDDRTRMSDIVDWPLGERDGYEMKRVNTVVNAFYYMNLVRMAEIAGVLGKKQEAAAFAEKAARLKAVFNRKLLDPRTGIYVDGEGSSHSALHANVFALAFGLVPEAQVKPVIAFIKSRGMACSVYAAQYLLEALYRYGEADYALQLMNSTTGDRNWYNMIRSGSTMALEAWDIRYKPNLDWNHAWGTAPANIIPHDMWGIRPAKPGFAKARIQPQLGTLTESAIKVPTIKGAIHAEYRQLDASQKQFVITLPEGMEGEFVLNQGDRNRLFLNGRPVNAAGGAVQLREGKNEIVIKRT
ncbi:MAG: family 78 glycoside hydrolase catalytic domain [Mucilaginibacter polytrichastri]|nr:family 78 glycoside hydrolase catalytic domain [Mucilaginibacter polytrichastri]